jgi:hypothetical protein
MRTRLLVVAICAAVAVLALATSVAVAHTFRAGSNIDIDDVTFPDGLIEIRGDVESPRNSCEVGRFVFAVAVDQQTGRVRFIDSDVTNVNGVFVLRGPLPEDADFVIVRVTRRETGGQGHRHICRRDTDSFAVGP